MRTASIYKQQNNSNVKQAEIAFTRPTPRLLKRGQFHTYKLCTSPTDAISPTYKLSVPFFNEGAPEEWI
eukprot:7860289-Ditylum_brightwellii.AAC.1